MKKSVLLFAILAIAFSLQAQKRQQVLIGLGGAFTNTWIVNQNFYGEPEVDYAPKFGGSGILTLGYAFTEKISAVTELGYSMQGQKYDGDQIWAGHDWKVERDIKLKYLNIPIFFKYLFGSGNTRFRFLAGPQFSILMDATQDYKRLDAQDNQGITELTNKAGAKFSPTDDDIKDRFEKSDFGMALDIGADIFLSKKFFVNAGLRMNYGFQDINAADYQIDPYTKPGATDEDYSPSHNLWGGLYVGINYMLDVESYKQRSF